MGNYMKILNFTGLILLLLVFSIFASGQEKIESATNKQVFLNVTVVNVDGEPVTDLKAEHFRLYEDKKPLKISYFSKENSPVSVGFLVDVSPSMIINFRNNKINRINWGRQTALDFLRESHKDNEYFLITYGGKILQSDFLNGDEMAKAIKTDSNFITPKEVLSEMYDAMSLANEKLSKAKNQRKILFILSDEQDGQLGDYYKKIADLVKKNGVIVFSLAINDPTAPNDFLNFSDLAYRLDLVELIGGVSALSKDLKQSLAFAANIAKELQNQYIIGFVPNASEKSNKWRKLEIKVEMSKEERKKHGKIFVRHRQGYILD